MYLTVAYKGHSALRRSADGMAFSLAPNLRRDRVSFSGTLLHPLRFREAVSALHDVVISDLRYKQRDKTAYLAYAEEEKKRLAEIRKAASSAARADAKAQVQEPVPPGLEPRFHQLRKRYWGARQKYSDSISRTDQAMWRLLMPCDPVITVAPDVLFFECFSADESSYGCLTVARDAFRAEDAVALGTTNVDYSWALYEEFQKLRSYKKTLFEVDPSGFEVHTAEEPGYREEKIDLPPSWLRGFMQIQGAMSLPMRRVTVSREGLYGVLAWLKRHRASKSPRALRFELTPGKPVELVLEPWEKRIVLHATPYSGNKSEVIRTWGRDRLRLLARLLPLAEGADVYLLGTGLPSFWSARMGEMRLLLALSGWTANDWTGGGSALDQLAPPADPDTALLRQLASAFVAGPALTFEQVRQRTNAAPALVAAGLNRLAQLGQVIHDLSANVYRWRQIMPSEISTAELGEESPETVAAKEFVRKRQVRVERNVVDAKGLRIVTGKAGGKSAEVVLDGDGRIVGGKCDCSHHHEFGIRRGPCRHLQALRSAQQGDKGRTSSLDDWYRTLWN